MENRPKTTSNNEKHPVVSRWELTNEECNAFDFSEYPEESDGNFFRYNNRVYDLGEFILIANKGVPPYRSGFVYLDGYNDFPNWQGIKKDTILTAIVIKYDENYDNVTVGEVVF